MDRTYPRTSYRCGRNPVCARAPSSSIMRAEDHRIDHIAQAARTGLAGGRAQSCGTGCMAMALRCSRPRGERRNTSSHFTSAAVAGRPHSPKLVSDGRFRNCPVRSSVCACVLSACLSLCERACLCTRSVSVFALLNACFGRLSPIPCVVRQERLKEWCVVCVERVEQQGHMSAGSLRRTSRRTFCSNGAIMGWATRQGCKDSSHPKIKAVNGDRPANGVIDSARVERAIWPTAQDECARGPGAGVDRWNSSLPPLVRDRHGGRGPPTPACVRS
jgi:hypothetical protein